MVDNSRSMIDEQQKLQRVLEGLLSMLATGDLQAARAEDTPGWGVQDFSPPRSIRVGVITPDLGTSPVMACPEGFGDDAELVSEVSDALS